MLKPLLNRSRKCVAAGTLAIALIPAIGFASTHHPMQAAPMMATATPTMAASPIVSKSSTAKPKIKHLKAAHKKLHAKRKAHTNLKHAGKSASTRKHTKLHAAKKKVA